MKPIKKQFARHLRRSQTYAEQIMWNLLKNRRFKGIKFRRQHVLEGFIVDFFCYKTNLIVEIDGDIHLKQKEYDHFREDILRSKGYRLIRFTNDEVVGNLSKVCEALEIALSLTLSPGERGKTDKTS
jgi:very-short-patch-repair endonuclease